MAGKKGRSGRKTPELDPGRQSQVRSQVQVAPLMKRLLDHALGKNKMTSTQIRAAEILLRKVVPDLKMVEFIGEVKHAHTMTQDELKSKLMAHGIDPAVALEHIH